MNDQNDLSSRVNAVLKLLVHTSSHIGFTSLLCFIRRHFHHQTCIYAIKWPLEQLVLESSRFTDFWIIVSDPIENIVYVALVSCVNVGTQYSGLALWPVQSVSFGKQPYLIPLRILLLLLVVILTKSCCTYFTYVSLSESFRFLYKNPY
jgi:hypothetical protein